MCIGQMIIMLIQLFNTIMMYQLNSYLTAYSETGYLNETKVPSSYLTDNTPNTYLSFTPNSGIITALLDEVIEDGPGSDIIINTFLNSTTNAEVYISHNNINFTLIGILDDNHNEFDLANISENLTVGYVKLHFFNYVK